jgi:poly-gamma-glutamate synthesis protein (capsule biosynthesis protein)
VSATGIRVLLVGDLILDEPDPDALLAPSAPVLRSGDVVIGQVEVPHSTRGQLQSADVPARPSDPRNLEALPRAGFNVATLAGNHIADAGPDPIEDTLAKLRELGLATAGAGMNLAEARAPAIVAADGVTVGVLSYNCVGPRESWARPSKPGCAYLNVLTHYELDHASPGGPPTIYTFATPETLEQMRRDIAELSAAVDVVIIAFHKGIGHLRAQVAMYEREIARAAIDAGADVVVGHHAHILRGIELYKGKPIYHGLGNFATVTRALSPSNPDTPEAAAWAKRRMELFGFAPDPGMPTYPFHPESRNTIIADCRVGRDGSVDAGFVPCWIDDDARPVPQVGAVGRSVVDYLAEISREAGLAAAFAWDGDRVVVGPSHATDA